MDNASLGIPSLICMHCSSELDGMRGCGVAAYGRKEPPKLDSVWPPTVGLMRQCFATADKASRAVTFLGNPFFPEGMQMPNKATAKFEQRAIDTLASQFAAASSHASSADRNVPATRESQRDEQVQGHR